MSKVAKNIAVFSLWLAGLVIIAHLFTPHDHHSDCNPVTSENDCHAGNSGHPPKAPVFPFHCHALNELTLEKTTPTLVINNSIPTCDLFIPGFTESAQLDNSLVDCHLRDYQKPPIKTDFLRLSHFRAPPVLS